MRNGTLCLLVLALGWGSAALAGDDPFADLRSEDPAVRDRGRAALATAGEDLLVHALGDADGAVRTAAAEAAGARRDPPGPALRGALRTAMLDRAAGEEPRRAAVRTLSARGDGATALDIRRVLEEFPREAALGLADLRDTGSLDALRALALRGGDSNPPEVGFALAVLGDPTGEDLLLAHLAGPRPEAARDAHHLLRRLTGRDLGPSEALWREVVRLRRLADALGSGDFDASEEAMQRVLASGPGALGDLLAVLEDERSSREARGKAALGLGLLGRREAGPALLRHAVPGADPWVRVYAAEALGRIAWSPAAPVLARWLVNDEDPDVPPGFFSSSTPYHAIPSAACRALLSMGCEGAFGVVVDYLSRGRVRLLPAPFAVDYKVRYYHEALAMLRDFGGPGAKGGFGFLPDGSEEDRTAAGTRALAWWTARPRDLAVERRADFSDPAFVSAVEKEIGILGRYKFLEMDRSRRALIILGRPVVPMLLAALKGDDAGDPAGQRRAGVAGVLSDIGATEAIPALRDALASTSLAPVRSRILVALAGLHPPEGLPEAVAALADGSADVRAAAAEALAIHPTAGAERALGAALDRVGVDDRLRGLLSSALLALKDVRGVPGLLADLSRDDAILRRTAWEILDGRLDGLGPYDPATGRDAAAVEARWKAQRSAPHFRDTGVVQK